MSWLDDASWLQKLQNASASDAREPSAIDEITVDTGILRVQKPCLYVPQQGERALFAAGESPPFFDRSGIAGRDDDLQFIVLSPDQIEADHSSRRAYLLPMIQTLYKEGADLVAAFTLFERLEGTATCMRGRLDLSSVFNQPDRFTPGPYALELRLDTPAGSVAAANRIAEAVVDLRRDPHTILDAGRMRAVARDAAALYERLPDIKTDSVYLNRFRVEAPVVCARHGDTDIYFVYHAGKNYAIHFSTTEFSNVPTSLTLIDGIDPASALTRLIKAGIFGFSKNMAQQNAARLASAAQADAGLAELAEDVRKASASLSATQSRNDSRTYLGRIPEKVIEFVVEPTIDSPVLTDILRRLSLSRASSTYWSMESVQSGMKSNPDETLDAILRAVLLSETQNNDVNLWLYQHHRERCEQQGISFSLVG